MSLLHKPLPGDGDRKRIRCSSPKRGNATASVFLLNYLGDWEDLHKTDPGATSEPE